MTARHTSYRTVCDRRPDSRSKKAVKLSGSHHPTKEQLLQTMARR